MRNHLRTRHYSIRTETAYVDWARRFILFHGKRHPQEMGGAEVEAFLTHLAVNRHVSASTQNQAKAAILYLYKQVLQIELAWLVEVVQAKTPKRLPVVLTASEVRALLLHMQGTTGLVAQLLYGTGMRLLEALRLRVKDVEFARREIVIREGKGNKDRITVLPENLILPLQAQLQKARVLHEKDLGKPCITQHHLCLLHPFFHLVNFPSLRAQVFARRQAFEAFFGTCNRFLGALMQSGPTALATTSAAPSTNCPAQTRCATAARSSSDPGSAL